MNYPPAPRKTAHNTDARFDWNSPIKEIKSFSVNGGPCDLCGKTDAVTAYRNGSRPAVIKVPQYRHRIIFDLPELPEKWCCTKCRNMIQQQHGVTRS